MERKSSFIFVILALSLLAAGSTSYRAPGDQMPIGIAIDRQNYTPLLSSTVGIGLTPVYPGDVDNRTVSFRWQTNYGHFVSWGAPDFKVYDLGHDVTTGDGKIYWSYFPENIGKDKPRVNVTLTMIDKATGKAINGTGIEVGWVNESFATVIS